jgi:mannan endo-1,4-beta-mannosidase
MDDFLRGVKQASEQGGTRLLDTWDIHWYPQRQFDGVYTHYLDDSTRTMTAEEIDAVLQGPRGYWDPEYDDQSWITDHMMAPVEILTRLQQRIDAAYPGTKLGVTEYFPGGRAHISSGIATVDTLGVFAQMGVGMAAMWPHEGRVEFAYGGIQLVRNADGNGVRFADHAVKVEHPEKIPSSVHAGADNPKVVTVTVVNKTAAARRFGIRLFNPAALTTVDAYRIDAEHFDPYAVGSQPLTKYNAYAYTAPPFTATMLVFRGN